MKKISLFIMSFIILALSVSCTQKEPDLVVGAKDFTEQYILGHMLKQLIEANTHLTVGYKHGMSTEVIFAGIRTGVVDLYVEYSGTIYSSHLKHAEAKNAEQVYAVIADELYAHFDLHVLEPLGFNNSFCLAVRPEMAEAYDLKTFSDLAKVSSAFAFGGSAEILNRFDGMPNLKRVYNMSFREEKAIDGPARYLAIANDETQVTEAFTTDGLLLVHDLVVLEDDKSFFPPYQGVIVIDNKMLEKYPELAEVLALLDGKLSNEIMRNLNYKVDVLGESPEAVAEGFLRLNGLLG